MGGSIPQMIVLAIASGALGVIAGLSIGNTISKRRIDKLNSSSQTRLDAVTLQRDQFRAKYAKAKSSIKELRAAVAKGRTELRDTLEKAKRLAKNVRMLRAEREDTKIKVGSLQKALVSVKHQTMALQNEFEKVGKFYKGELTKSFDKRKALEVDLENARAEHEAFTKLVESSVLEHGSPEEMITAAQLRLGQLEVLERNVSKLEAENAKLGDDAKQMKREYDSLAKDLAELDELRINNRQLVRCVESLENSRKQHELEAEQYRDQADQSEQMSDTLRLKLDDLEKNFADMEEQQNQAIKRVRKSANDATSDADTPSPLIRRSV